MDFLGGVKSLNPNPGRQGEMQTLVHWYSIPHWTPAKLLCVSVRVLHWMSVEGTRRSLLKCCPELATSYKNLPPLPSQNRWTNHNQWHSSQLHSYSHCRSYQWFDNMFLVTPFEPPHTHTLSLHDTQAPRSHQGLPSSVCLSVWLCSQRPHLLWMNAALETISPDGLQNASDIFSARCCWK